MRPISAAASAGTTASGSATVSSDIMPAVVARTPMAPAIRLAAIVLVSDSSLAERPASWALTSFSETARVARPKRVSL